MAWHIAAKTLGGVECAPGAGQVEVSDLTGELGFQRMKAMARQRSHSIEFKQQVAQEFIAGESLYALPSGMISRVS